LQERSVATDAAKLAAMERLEAADSEAASLAQKMAEQLQAAAGMCGAQMAAGAAGSEAAAHAATAAHAQVLLREGELQAARQQLAEAEQRAGSDGGLLALQQQVAAAEEEVRLLTDKQQRQCSLQALLEHAGATVRQLASARSQAAAELAACQVG
jgi:hypothetical protein